MNKNLGVTERLWAGRLGEEYLERNQPGYLNPKRAYLIKRIIKCLPLYEDSGRILEVGVGAGENLAIFAQGGIACSDLYGVDVSDTALEKARLHLLGANLLNAPADDLPFYDNHFSLVLTMGLLIHIPPDKIQKVYSELWRVGTTLAVCEYFNPTPQEIPYRGEMGLLWRRDFGGELKVRGEEMGYKIGVLGFGCERKMMDGFDDLDFWVLKREA